jgi:hypothetical protein
VVERGIGEALEAKTKGDGKVTNRTTEWLPLSPLTFHHHTFDIIFHCMTRFKSEFLEVLY